MSDEATQAVEPAAGGLPVPQAPPAAEAVGSREGMFGVHGTGDTSGYGGLTQPVLLPMSSPRPYGGWFDEVADTVERVLPDPGATVEAVRVEHGELVFVVRREHLLQFMQAVRDDPTLRFEMCLGVCGAHFPERAGRELLATYPLLSYTHNRRIRVEVTVPDADPHIPSVVAVYPGNDWHERETYDFFGLRFDGHPALTRIQMPDDWPGHPQRKDYPLGGIPVEYKGATIPPPDQRRAYT